ncbi:cupin domain-containing protein [Leptolyngbya sp. FACHB-261]|uniref:cupin domain-containing protein n=1 Tax=Leptolyngbya sp. FACHB-261 TaxID=2692806 RepID=UPI001685A06E|nr:cupin domain-containing protein [Leptolyngbya sp. FACHB-261]MBD2100234.1 cupin domain-containing protein [Leptolyngbya sp. FACHB-261]
MLIRALAACAEERAGDGTQLRQLLHPDKQAIEIRYSLAHAVVQPGQVSLPHSLSTSEVYYILSGQGVMHIDEEEQAVGPEQAIYIPPDARQFIENTGEQPLVFICIVDPAWRVENETIFA